MTFEVDLGITDLSDYKTIGTGGFSTVMSAWDKGFRRRVAIKVIHSLDEAGRRRFERERGIMGQLSSHTNVIMPFRAGYTVTGAPYLVMELVEGGSLEDLSIARGPIPWREAIDFTLSVTAALSHAHNQGILHRDVKPANILLAGATPKLTDFGIASLRESTASVVAYTLTHCPPETFASGYDNRDERSDLYSMASTLYTLLSGGFAPYDVEEPDSQQAYMFRIIGHELPELPAELNLPEALRAFLRAGLSKDPGDRPQSADEFSRQMREILAAGDDNPRTNSFGDSGNAKPTMPTVTHHPDVTDIDSDATRPMLLPPAPAHTTGGGDNAQIPVLPALPSVEDPPATTVTTGSSSFAALNFPPPTSKVRERVDVGDHGPSPNLTANSRPLVGTPKARKAAWPKRIAVLAAVALLAGAVGGGVWALNRRPTDLAPPIAWQFETFSALSSKPAVEDSTLVIGARITNKVHALNTETGEERWSFETDGGIDAAPTIADGVVFIGSIGGAMYALDLDDGSLIWEQDLGLAIRGPALVDGERVYVGTDPADFFALDRATGEEVWVAEIDSDRDFPVLINTRPVAITAAGTDVIAVGVTDGGLYLYEPSTGELVERVGLPSGAWHSNPLVLDRPGGGQELWIGTSTANSGALARVNLEDLTINAYETSAGVGTDAAITSEGYIVFGNDTGELYAIDRSTLGEIWREGYADATQIKGSPVVYGNQIIIGTHDKELISISSEDGTELWRFEGRQVFGLAAPVIVDDQLFVGNDSGTVYRFDL